MVGRQPSKLLIRVRVPAGAFKMKCYRFTKGIVREGIPIDTGKPSLHGFSGILGIMNSGEGPEIKTVVGYYDQKTLLYSADVDFSPSSLTLKKETEKTKKDIFAYIRTSVSTSYKNIQEILNDNENKGVELISYVVGKLGKNNILKTLIVLPNNCSFNIRFEDTFHSSNQYFNRKFENKDGFLTVPKDVTGYKII